MTFQPNPSDDPDLRDILLALGMDPDEDFSDLGPEDLSATPPDQWEDCTHVTPPAAILRYLASGDTFSNHTIDMMEIAIEKAYKVQPPWFIASTREGSEDEGNLSVKHFSLMREAPAR